MTTLASDAFARLSPEIVFDVLKTGCPKFEDLKELEKTDAVWGDTIRCRRFEQATMDTQSVVLETYSYGLMKSVVEEPARFVLNNRNAMSFIYVDLQLGKLSLEFENWILENVSQSLKITFYWDFMRDRASEVLEILSTRPLSKLLIAANGDFRFEKFWKIPFQKLLKNPSLHQLKIMGSMWSCLDLIEPLLEFIKRPNFVSLDTAGAKTLGDFVPLVVEHWLQLSTLPTHMQCIRFRTNKTNYLQVLDKMGFKIKAQIDWHHSVHFMDHPNDDSKQIECYIYGGSHPIAELCLTSKEDSVREEFSDYDDFKFRERIQMCGGSFDVKYWECMKWR